MEQLPRHRGHREKLLNVSGACGATNKKLCALCALCAPVVKFFIFYFLCFLFLVTIMHNQLPDNINRRV